VPRLALVGRVAERAVVDECLQSALAGRRRVLIVAGEPGAGKTRLAEHAADEARRLGLSVALGRATEDDGSPPYWPFRQVLKALGIASTVPLDGAGSSRERFALFQDVDDALAQAGEAVGLLVVLDDLQWADAATIGLLTHVSTAVASSRLAVIVTYRDTETTGQEAVRAAMARLVGESSVTRVRLGGLAEAEVAVPGPGTDLLQARGSQLTSVRHLISNAVVT
jgi:predicted ATPase